MTDSKIIEKVTKLLALSESANPNEAAIALARAQKLMQEHSLSMSDVTLNGIVEQAEDVPSILKDKRLYTILANIVGRAFGLELFYHFRNNRISSVVFVGPNDRVPSACYAFTIIARNVAIAKKLFLAEQRQNLLEEYAMIWDMEVDEFKALFKSLNNFYLLFPDYKSEDNTRLRSATQAYIRGYLMSVYEKVEEFATTDEEQLLIEEYQSKHHPDLGSMRRTRVGLSKEDMAHYYQGERDGQEGFELFHGVNGSMTRHELTYQR